MDKHEKKKELEGLKEGLPQKHTSIHSKQHSEMYKIWKRQAIIAYVDTGFKNSLPSTTDWRMGLKAEGKS